MINRLPVCPVVAEVVINICLAVCQVVSEGCSE